MLIIEGRYVTSGESYQDHANFVIENLLIKASSLNQMSMGSDPKFVVQIARKVSHHSCYNQLSPQVCNFLDFENCLGVYKYSLDIFAINLF